jgi:glycosyltransferase involved in cell wall biosynthesis
MEYSPTISVITPSLNAGQTIDETLWSAKAQEVTPTEHLLIDAGSCDGTLGIAEKHAHLTVVSEPDQGIYDGMNKGARAASGEWLLFLQGDDWLPEGALAAYRTAILMHPDAEIFCGDAEAVKVSESGRSLVWAVRDSESKKLTFQNIALGEPMINARLIRRDVFLGLGGFSLDYTLASDREFLLRAVTAGIRQVELPVLTYRYRWHSGSSTMTEGNSLTARLSEENLSIARKYLAQTQGDEVLIFKKWHSRLLLQMAMNALESPGMKGLLTAAREGIEVDQLWPFRFIAEILRSLPGFLMRRGRTRSHILERGNQSD